MLNHVDICLKKFDSRVQEFFLRKGSHCRKMTNGPWMCLVIWPDSVTVFKCLLTNQCRPVPVHFIDHSTASPRYLPLFASGWLKHTQTLWLGLETL